MNKSEFLVGETVYHKSNPSVLWVIEVIEGAEAHCSTLSEDKELKKETFNLASLAKESDKGTEIYFGKSANRHRY